LPPELLDVVVLGLPVRAAAPVALDVPPPHAVGTFPPLVVGAVVPEVIVLAWLPDDGQVVPLNEGASLGYLDEELHVLPLGDAVMPVVPDADGGTFCNQLRELSRVGEHPVRVGSEGGDAVPCVLLGHCPGVLVAGAHAELVGDYRLVPV